MEIIKYVLGMLSLFIFCGITLFFVAKITYYATDINDTHTIFAYFLCFFGAIVPIIFLSLLVEFGLEIGFLMLGPIVP